MKETSIPMIYSMVAGLLVMAAVEGGHAQCAGLTTIPPQAENCVCMDSGCAAEQYVINSYTVCTNAPEGTTHCISSSQYVGNRFPCYTELNWSTFSACCILMGACGAMCALTCGVPPACVACLVARGASGYPGCTGCALITCSLGNTGTPVYMLVGSLAGNPCPP